MKKTTIIPNNNDNIQEVDVLILGAGASGLMCAMTAAKRGRKVALVDHNDTIGKKIRISGGGKANFTNVHMGSAYYIGNDPSFTNHALDFFPPKNIIDFMLAHGLAYEEREHGQLFGLESASRIIEAFERQCLRHNVRFLLGKTIQHVEKKAHSFIVQCTNNSSQQQSITVIANNLVLALGSPAYANLGATQKGLEIAKYFGHTYTPFMPALTSLIMPKNWALSELSGISLPVRISTESFSRHDPLLFTHKGISGPAVLQLSCYWKQNTPIYIDFLPHTSLKELLDARECGKLFVQNLICRHMPQRLAQRLIPQELAKRKIAELSRAARNTLHTCIHAYSVIPENTAGMSKAEAAMGGVHTKEINSYSMESLQEKGLYIVGELLDITGQLGGYNLHWAFASGYIAGLQV